MEGLYKAGEQVVMIDPKGEGYGLQSSFDGKGKGLDFIVFGEPYGNIKLLREEHATHLADFVTTSGRSVVLSLLGFDTNQAERRFVRDFFQRLFRNKSRQEQRSRLLLVIDEAHLFVPEGSGAGLKGDQAELTGAIQRCVRQGRTYGIGVMLVDQRPADVSKKLVSQCELVITHALSHPTDRKALKEWMSGFGGTEQHEGMLDQVTTLQSGEAFVWSPSWLKIFEHAQIDRMTTFDSGASPDADESSRPKVKANVDIAELESALKAVIEEEKASDPKKLQAQVADLKKKLQEAEAKPAQVDTAAYEQLQQQHEELTQQAANDKALLESEVAELRTKIGRIRRFLGDQGDVEESAPLPPRAAAGMYTTTPAPKSYLTKPPAPMPILKMPKIVLDKSAQRPKPKPVVPVESDSSEEESDDEVNGEKRMLGVLARYPDTTRQDLAIMSMMSPGSGTFLKYLSNNRSAGLIEDGSLQLTDAGREVGASVPAPKRGASLRAAWHKRVGVAGVRRMLDVIFSAYPGGVTRQQLAEDSSMTAGSGTFLKYLSNLRSKNIVDESKDGDKKNIFKAPPVFFKEG